LDLNISQKSEIQMQTTYEEIPIEKGGGRGRKKEEQASRTT
jgi:hypothetical protein